VEIHLPALRERREDIPALAAHFLGRYAQRYRVPVKGFGAAAMQTMMQYAWPGNVRELEHTLERAVLMAQGEEVQVSDLGLNLQRPQGQNLEELSIEEVEGILVRGENDYIYDTKQGCYKSNVCPMNGCRGEDVTKITSLPLASLDLN